MICYNITIKVDPGVEKEWVEWQSLEHIPEIMSTGLFTEFKFYKLLEQDETDGITYAVQFFSPSLEKYNSYISEFAPKLREKAFAKWKHQFVAFRTVMKLVN